MNWHSSHTPLFLGRTPMRPFSSQAAPVSLTGAAFVFQDAKRLSPESASWRAGCFASSCLGAFQRSAKMRVTVRQSGKRALLMLEHLGDRRSVPFLRFCSLLVGHALRHLNPIEGGAAILQDCLDVPNLYSVHGALSFLFGARGLSPLLGHCDALSVC